MDVFRKCVLVSVFAIFWSGIPVLGKDLTNRLGVGFKNNTSQDVPSLAVVYFADKDYAFTGAFGFDTQKNYSHLQLNAGARKIIYFENNLNYFMGAQAGIVNYESPVDGKNTGLDFNITFGTEIFFNGLENLGFSFEAGVGLSNAQNVRFRTLADGPLRAGIIFYF